MDVAVDPAMHYARTMRFTPARAALLAAVSVLAWGPSAQAEALTLAEALRRADRQNERPAVARTRLAQAQAARRQAYAALLPVLSFSGTYRRRDQEVVREVSGVDVVIQRDDAFSGAGRADLALLDATAFSRMAAARHLVDARDLDAKEARRLLWLEVAEAFFTVLAAEQVEQAAIRRVEVGEVESRAAARRLDAGLVGRNVLTRARLELESARLERVQSRDAVVQARLGLGFLVGGEVPAKLVEPEGPVVEHLPAPALVRRAIEVRQDARSMRASVRAADALEDEPWLGLVPRLDATALLTWTNESGFRGDDTEWTVAVTATWIAYNGGVRYAEAARREAELDELRLLLGELERQVRLEVRRAMARLSAAVAAREVARARLEAAEQNLEEVRARFDRGLANALELADASEQAFVAAADVAGQRLGLRLAELDLMRATGRWPGGRERS